MYSNQYPIFYILIVHVSTWLKFVHTLLPYFHISLFFTLLFSFLFSFFRSFDDDAERFGCEVHGFDPTGLLWRQGMHGKDYSGIDYAKVCYVTFDLI